MRILNTREVPKYVGLTGNTVSPYGRTPELRDVLTGIGKIVDACGSSLLLVLSKADREVLDKLMELDRKGQEFVPPPAESIETEFERVRKAELREQRAKVASVLAAAKAEEDIRSETRFASRSDKAAAGRKADAMSGKVEARRIDDGGEIDYGKASLSDIIGHDRFIEENAGKSGIPMVVASDDETKPSGWDFKKEEPKDDDKPVDKPVDKSVDKPVKAEKTKKGKRK